MALSIKFQVQQPIFYLINRRQRGVFSNCSYVNMMLVVSMSSVPSPCLDGLRRVAFSPLNQKPRWLILAHFGQIFSSRQLTLDNTGDWIALGAQQNIAYCSPSFRERYDGKSRAYFATTFGRVYREWLWNQRKMKGKYLKLNRVLLCLLGKICSVGILIFISVRN